jgi:2-amino-4-hydroxy-6-hydroxymethyldihydropteridine diphosphokinase
VPHTYLLLLGSNLAGPERLRAALASLATLGTVTPLTEVERMPARGDASRFYYNALARLDSTLARNALDARLKQIEVDLGRVRDGSGSVAIDIDLLATRTPDGWRADPHALAKQEFVQTPARDLLAKAGIAID